MTTTNPVSQLKLVFRNIITLPKKKKSGKLVKAKLNRTTYVLTPSLYGEEAGHFGCCMTKGEMLNKSYSSIHIDMGVVGGTVPGVSLSEGVYEKHQNITGNCVG